MPSITKEQIAAAVDGWFGTATQGGPIARDTEAFNQMFKAKESLKADLNALIAEGASPADQ